MEAEICGVAADGCAEAATAGACSRCGLRGRRGRLGLRWECCLLVRLGLGEEVLVAEEDGQHQEHEGHGGAHIAATTAAGPLRLQIGILNFGQRILPIVGKGSPQGRRLLYGNGSRGNAVGALRRVRRGRPAERAGTCGRGTGSNPPGVKGWQRNRRHAASPQPRSGPCVAMAVAAYSEHVGMELAAARCSTRAAPAKASGGKKR